MRLLKHLVAVAAVALIATSVFGLIDRDDPSPSVPSTPGAVEIAGFAFGPETARVAVGTTVTWTNTDSTAHTVDSADRELDSDSIGEGATFEHAFDAPGTYAYVCAFHPFMKGTVEVTG